MDQDQRAKYAYIEGWTSIVGNAGLFIVKICIGIAINSISLMADAFHTLSDVLTSVMVVVGFKIAKIPADDHHPYGHGRMESIATLIVGFLLGVVAYEIGKGSIRRFATPVEVKWSLLAVVITIASAAIKELMAQFSFSLGRKINSEALHADAWHHRSDAISSVLILAALIGAKFRLYTLDAVFGLVVAVFIGYTAFKISYSTIDKLLGHAPEEDVVEKIKKTAMSVSGVKGVHDIAVHSYGGHKEILMHIEVEQNINIDTAHEIATSVENRVADNSIGNATVHIEIKENKTGDDEQRQG